MKEGGAPHWNVEFTNLSIGGKAIPKGRTSVGGDLPSRKSPRKSRPLKKIAAEEEKANFRSKGNQERIEFEQQKQGDVRKKIALKGKKYHKKASPRGNNIL